MQRRQFIQLTSALTGFSLLPASCSITRKTIKGSIVGASAGIGHLLRDGTLQQPPVAQIQTQVVIIGGGISALSAARWLHKHNIKEVVMLELEKQAGGNASCGSNAVSAYPWGAHYVPIANNTLQEYLEFLQECDVITGYNAEGLPVYNEYFLCSDPQERLYINGSWQDGVVPFSGLPAKDKAEINRFLQQMNAFKTAKGADGKEAFTIPVDWSSKDAVYTALDTITMQQWLQQQQYTSSYLHWYVNYCTRDDFGTIAAQISAWAGIHYFASRKGKAANAASHDVVTWPEGNGWLARQLMKEIQPCIHTNSLAVKVLPDEAGVTVHYYDVVKKQMLAVRAQHCIMAVPQFVGCRLLPQAKQRMQLVNEHMHYTPWMVANIAVGDLEERSGAPASWDNVLYNSNSLGYVDATHQQIAQLKTKRVLTYYLPLTEGNAADERKKALQRTHEQWVKLITDDLKIVHPDIVQQTEQVDVMLWGHAMAQPLPQMIHGNIRAQLQSSEGPYVHFAHTDLAGISIFEEAFYQGISCANKVIRELKCEDKWL